ncbi:MAG: glycerol-3-phosphate 1-O-acyltransferase PlsY [Deltaproteobacteria bacterium]|nr:glycerol-3-phosphate 1-O-acyltransferase PlsY [Deltaproteobacteria bacterium]
MELVSYLITLIPFYCLGAVPTGTLIARKKRVDLHLHGSGNVGATNVSRVLGTKLGLLTLLLDTLKGFLAVILSSIIFGAGDYSAGAGVAAVLGHCFSIPGKLRGGKGVATALGITLAISPLLAFLALIVFATMLVIFKIVSLASVSAVLFVPVVAMMDAELAQSYQNALMVSALVVVFRHKTNLIRIAQGQEPRYSPAKSRS